jgi:hypothetical protein
MYVILYVNDEHEACNSIFYYLFNVSLGNENMLMTEL